LVEFPLETALKHANPCFLHLWTGGEALGERIVGAVLESERTFSVVRRKTSGLRLLIPVNGGFCNEEEPRKVIKRQLS
jgi:hypothetical protein